MKMPIALLAGVLLTISVASAQPPEDPPPPGPRFEVIALLLDLDDAQKPEVQRILEEERTQMRAAREQAMTSQTKPDREAMHQLHEQQRQHTLTSLATVLNQLQLQKYQALTERPPRPERGGQPK